MDTETTSGHDDTAPPLLTIDADRLRAALAVGLFATRSAFPSSKALWHVRLTVADGVLYAQATDQYVAALYRTPAPDATDFDALVHRDHALAAAKALRSAAGDATIAHGPRTATFDVTHAKRGRTPVPTVTELPWQSAPEAASDMPWPRMVDLLCRDQDGDAVAGAIDPAKLDHLVQWQRLAAGPYSSPVGVLLAPVSERGRMFRAVIEPAHPHDEPEGLAALLMGVTVNPGGDTQSADDLAAYARTTARELIDGAPR